MLSEVQQLSILGGSVDAYTFANWRQAPPPSLEPDLLKRLSYVIGIYEGLKRIFRHVPEQTRRWPSVSRPEPPFAGRTPLEVMTSAGAGLAAVRHCADGVNGGPPSRDVATQPRDVAG